MGNVEKLNILLSECKDILNDCKIPFNKNVNTIHINNRITKTLGQCKKEGKDYRIEISGHILESPNEKLKEVILHELIHTCPKCMNHGELWKRHANIVNRKYGYNIKRIASSSNFKYDKKAKEKRYKIKCQKCGCIYIRRRRCKLVDYPERFRCGRCGGGLVLYKKETS